MPHEVKTLCPYCGVGCGLLASTDGARVLKVRGDPSHPANLGKICLKGGTVALTVNVPTRLRYPMCRDAGNPGGDLSVVSPATAIRAAAERLDRVLQSHGPGGIGFYLSGQLTTESQYFFNKFAKGYLRTNHLDSNSRLCMSSAASGMSLSLGSDGPPTSYADIELADAFFFIGSNAADCHPVTFERVARQIKKKGARCVVADPRRTKTADAAHVHLPVRPGTDLALLNGLLRLLRDWGKLDPAYIAERTEGWDALDALLNDYPPQFVADTCCIKHDDLIATARVLAGAKRLITFWTMGINQTLQGTFSSNAIINLHLATGQIGKPGCGPFSLTGQPNAMGGRDVGYMSHLLPGQRQVANPEHRRRMEEFWGLAPGAIYPHAGHDAVNLFDALDRGELKAIWIVGTNPAASMPNLPRVRRALEKAELVIVQDAYFPTETTRFAHVLLPAAVTMEQAGTFCNSERRVTLMEPVVPPPGDARPDWEWGREVAAAMGFKVGLQFARADDVFDEFARSTAGRPNDQSALSYELLRKKGPQQWPYPALGISAARRYGDGEFPTPTGKARLWARPHLPAEEAPTDQFPLLLTTGRVASQWHTRTKTGCVPQLNQLAPAPFLAMSPPDAAGLGLREGQRVEVRSRRGRAWSLLRVDGSVPAGVVFSPIHWNDLWSPGVSPNEATSDATDPISREPALKVCAVSVRGLTADPAADVEVECPAESPAVSPAQPRADRPAHIPTERVLAS